MVRARSLPVGKAAGGWYGVNPHATPMCHDSGTTVLPATPFCSMAATIVAHRPGLSRGGRKRGRIHGGQPPPQIGLDGGKALVTREVGPFLRILGVIV
jgi:hypothetical protein